MILRLLDLLVRLAALAVPSPARARWREEWLGEIDQVARGRGARAALHVAAGAIPDALAVRRIASARKAPMASLVSWTDLKLAVRMLVRYPGLTLVGALGMAVGIAISAGAFSIIYTLTDDALPFDEGDRVVAILNWDAAANRPERRVLHDLASWRTQLTSVQDVGAFRQVTRNLIAAGVQTDTVQVAEMSAAGFRVARVPPLLGRHLVDDDERPGAPAVVVIAASEWRRRFAADPAIVGRTVRLGETEYTVAGVMPDGFAFPVNNRFWVPLRIDAAQYERRKGPSLIVFGRLAPGATLEGAASELRLLGERAAAAFPQTNDKLRPRVLPYTYPFFDMDDPSMGWIAHVMQFLISLLLFVVCVNVAILVYARTATRQGEIAVRSALGASRRRIVSQLLLEALVLTGIASLAGLLFTAAGLRQVEGAMGRLMDMAPFWWRFRLSPGVVLYVAALAMFAALVVGAFPALKATGRRVQSGLQGLSAGGGARMRLGRMWTLLIVAQVAFAVALLPVAIFHAWDSIRYGMNDPGFAASEFLTAQIVMDRPAPAATAAEQRAFDARYADRFAEVLRRLREEPGIANVTFGSNVPGEEATAWIEAEGVAVPERVEAANSGYGLGEGSKAGFQALFSHTDAGLFGAFDVPILAGRGFEPKDAAAGAATVIVNRTFARNILGDQPLGRRIRYVGRAQDVAPDRVTLGRWLEVVGVVEDFPARTETGIPDAKVYHAAAEGAIPGATVVMRVRGTPPPAFGARLREITASVDASLQLRAVASMDEVLKQDQAMLRLVAAVLAILTLSVVLLSAAGIYALMSFTVAQRRKEIGIRAALGADPRRLLGSIFARAFRQLAAGAVLGAAIAALLEQLTEGELMRGNGAIVLPIVAVFMTGVGLLAALGPARRGLRIHPTEALREE